MKTSTGPTLLVILPALAMLAPGAAADEAPVVLPAGEGFLYSTPSSIGPFVGDGGGVAMLARPGDGAFPYADSPWRWTPDGSGFLPMPEIDGVARPWVARGMSGDGSLLSGAAYMDAGGGTTPVVWSATSGFLPGFDDFHSVHMTGLGIHVLGVSRGGGGIPAGLYRVTLAGERTPLVLGAEFEVPGFGPTAVNLDATVVVGQGCIGGACDAPWIADGSGLRTLPIPDGLADATPYFVSDGGDLAIGTGFRLVDGAWMQALVLWRNEVPEILPLPADTEFIALQTASSACDIVKGSYERPSGNATFIWRDGAPIESEAEYLAWAGFDKAEPNSRIFAFSSDASVALVLQSQGLVVAGGLPNPGCGFGGSCFEERSEPGCDDPTCCTTVCEIDPFCCAVVWDTACVSFATSNCTCGNPAAGSCFAAHANPGCANASCCATVCESDPFCCERTWDEFCAEQAAALCGDCGSPGSGSCAKANGTPGCADAACCAAICATDPFCCETEWDALCAAATAEACGTPPAPCGQPDSGSCTVANGTPGCADEACCTTVCAIDPYCCATAWDATCVVEVSRLCTITPGDLDGDGVVNAADLSILLGNWGGGGASDLDGDGTTNAADLSILLGNWS